jgi:hypothetical protein
MVGMSRSLTRSVRAALRPLLVHRYARTTPNSVPVLDDDTSEPVLDDWGEPVLEDGPTTSGLPCLYQSSKRLVVRDEGTVLLDVPTLTVYHDDPLAVGDRVTVQTRGGTVLVAAAVVDSFDPSAESGESALKVATLTSAEAVS